MRKEPNYILRQQWALLTCKRTGVREYWKVAHRLYRECLNSALAQYANGWNNGYAE